jgi:hypothetical protein
LTKQTPPISTPAHGCVPEVVVVVVVVDDVGAGVVGGCVVVDVVVEAVVVVGFMVVVVVEAVVVVALTVVVVLEVVAVEDVVLDEVVLDDGGGLPAGLDGTQSPKTGAKNRRRSLTTRTGKHTRSIGAVPADVLAGTHSTPGSSTRTETVPTVTGNGGANRAEVRVG